MDRQAWLAERRAAVVADYDRGAATYDDLPYPADVQYEWVARLLRTVPDGGTFSIASTVMTASNSSV